MKKKKRTVAVIFAITAVIIAMLSVMFFADCGTEVPPPTPGEDTVITKIKETPDKAAPENAIFAAINLINRKPWERPSRVRVLYSTIPRT